MCVCVNVNYFVKNLASKFLAFFAATDIVVFVSVDIFKEVLIRENEGSSLWYVVST